MHEAEVRIEKYLDKKSRMEAFQKLLCMPEDVYDFAKEKIDLLKDQEEIVLFGAGLSGITILGYLRRNGVEPCAFCDNNPAKRNQRLEGLEIISFSDLKEKYKDAYILISCDAYREIIEQLVDGGFRKENITFFDPNWIRRPNGLKDYIMKHICDFEEGYYLLEDQKSKEVYTALLNYKMTHELKYIETIADEHMYFDSDLIQIEPDDVFLDVGAYTGDTLIEYIEACCGKYGKVVCLEPNEKNVEILNQTLAENELDNVDVYPVGASDKKQTLAFSVDSNVASRVSKDGAEQIECDTIDNICLKKYTHINMIKMDIEGSEYYALLGAKEVIKRDHPKLAVCVYHKEDDFFKLPLLIKELYSGYRLYFRQYELSAEETVCYAIP